MCKNIVLRGKGNTIGMVFRKAMVFVKLSMVFVKVSIVFVRVAMVFVRVAAVTR